MSPAALLRRATKGPLDSVHLEQPLWDAIPEWSIRATSVTNHSHGGVSYSMRQRPPGSTSSSRPIAISLPPESEHAAVRYRRPRQSPMEVGTCAACRDRFCRDGAVVHGLARGEVLPDLVGSSAEGQDELDGARPRDAARATGVSTDTLRYYERRGPFPTPPERRQAIASTANRRRTCAPAV
jgi:hypothetical protein